MELAAAIVSHQINRFVLPSQSNHAYYRILEDEGCHSLRSVLYICKVQCIRVCWHEAQALPQRLHGVCGVRGVRGVAMPPMEVLAMGSRTMLFRPCVDCGLYTGRFCDYCLAKDRIPTEDWAPGQMTPLCSTCDWEWDACHVCRGVQSCTPPARGTKLVDEEPGHA